MELHFTVRSDTVPTVNVVLRQTLSEDRSHTTPEEGVGDEEHPYLPQFPLPDIRATPYTLPSGFQWTTCNLTDDGTCDEIRSLFTVMTDSPFNLHNDSKEYLWWSLCPPGYFHDWHIGVVRKDPCRKLVAFVAAVPARIRIRNVVFPMLSCVTYMCMFLKKKQYPSCLIQRNT
ncbi:hypothetical protein MLD38_006918 [Melastoma candidum]|uniref:Uncharacterized protein n=1 Tax=Melastoma candidum TaxID=119954 RepID=A0ACB9RSG3_9MYRT|nr:hypothetical protein MLD38_006918 [Melastoma candidum]